MNYKEKCLKYKSKYFALKNQIGSGPWTLFFQETDGRPYYESIYGKKIWAGKDEQISPQTIVTTVKTDPETGYVILRPRFNNEYEDDHDIYYVDRYDKITGENFELNVKNNKTRKFPDSKKNARELWEIKSIDQIKYMNNAKYVEVNNIDTHKDPLDTSLIRISGDIEEIQGEELEKFISNNNDQDGLYIGSVPNAYLRLGSQNVYPDSKKIFVPNRFAIHGHYGNFHIIPIYYINENQQIKNEYYDLIDASLQKDIDASIKLGFTDNEIRLQQEKKMKEIFEDKIMNSKGFWLALAKYSVGVTIRGDTTYAVINHAYSDYLVKGYGKAVTCFLIKYLLKEYPSDKLVLTLKSARGSGKAWVTHGFIKKEGLDSGMIEQVDHILDLSKSSSICNDVLFETGIDKFLYYNSIEQVESKLSNKL